MSLALGFLISPLDTRAASRGRPVISRITIRGTDIFDFETKPNLRKFPYNAINFLHIRTKEYVLRQQLLFKEGDHLDVFLLRETERNLRALPFIRAARCVTFPQRDGTVTVVVHVNDAWTTEPQLNLSGANRVDRLQIGFKEKNFLGFGKTVDYFHTKKNGVAENEFGYFDPNLLGSRWQTKAQVTKASNGGGSREIRLQRPFYATDVRWSAFTSHIHEDEIVETFSNNVKVSEYKQSKETSEVAGGLKLGGSRDVVNHAGLRYHREHVSSEPTDEPTPVGGLPEAVVRQTVFLDLERFRNNYIEETHLERMTRIEDINLGARASISPGYAPRDLSGKPTTNQLLGSFDKYTELGPNHLMQTYFQYSSRNTFAQAENARYRVEMKDYYKGWPIQTFVTHARLEWGEQLDPDNLIELGSENGLRAFKNVAFRGSKSFLLNLEDRFVFSDEVADLFSFGAATFFDSGYVWETGKPVDLKDMRSSVGVGFRLGLTRSANEVVLRGDLSYRLRHAPDDTADWVFTFGSDQAF